MYFLMLIIIGYLLSQIVKLSVNTYLPGEADRLWGHQLSRQLFLSLFKCCQRTRSRDDHTLLATVTAPDWWLYTFTGITATFIVWVTTGNVAEFIPMIALSSLLAVLAMIDWQHYLLPDCLVFSILWSGLLLSLSFFTVTSRDAIIGILTGYLSLWLLNESFYGYRRQHGIGHGDMKLLSALGAWCGWQPLPLILLSASLISLAYYWLVRIRYLSNRHLTIIPFGTFLAICGWGVILYHFGSQ